MENNTLAETTDGPRESCETTGANKFVQCDHEPINTCHEHELT